MVLKKSLLRCISSSLHIVGENLLLPYVLERGRLLPSLHRNHHLSIVVLNNQYDCLNSVGRDNLFTFGTSAIRRFGRNHFRPSNHSLSEATLF
jgi:hypothetical protein